MGFLRRVKVPDELPDLAVEDGSMVPGNLPAPPAGLPKPGISAPNEQNTTAEKIHAPLPKEVSKPDITTIKAHSEIAGEDYLEFQDKLIKRAEGTPESLLEMAQEDKDKEGFFGKILDDINGEMNNLGKLEDWYMGEFAEQDVVSNMKSYWEGNKADMIIRSFGSEYKKKIATKVKQLQSLEHEWREIYFTLIKKEEEMKREEKELKDTVSEFVDLCKRRKGINSEKTETETRETQEEKEST